MKNYSLVALDDRALMRGLHECASNERTSTADLLAHIAEVDHRKLHVPEACPSMYDYCLRRMGMSEDEAIAHLRVARIARQFPVVFPAIASGRLHRSAVLMLRKYLTPANAADLLRAVEGKTKRQIAALLAERFPRPDVPTSLRPLDEAPASDAAATKCPDLLVPEPVTATTAGPSAAECRTERTARVSPLAPRRFALELTIDEEMNDLLVELQDLYEHAVPSRDLLEVLKRTARETVERHRRRKYGATDSPRRRRGSENDRYIPADVRRGVWERDGGRCTFVSESGHRCEARSRLEFDHELPVARGGRSTAGNVRLRCRAHNQYAAERVFGAGFMLAKREEAKARREAERVARERRREAECAAREQARAHAQASREQARAAERAERERAKAEAAARKQAEATKRALIEEVVPALQNLGYPLARARAAAATTECILDAPIKDRILLALKSLTPPCRRYGPDGREKVA